jgi:hypothetical protein
VLGFRGNKMKKLSLTGLACILFFLIIGPEAALGLGVSPSRTTLTYEPNAVYEGYLSYSMGGIPRLKVSVEGEFAQNVELINIGDDNVFYPENGALHYKFTMPDHLDGPGIHRTIITAVESPEESSGSGISAVVAIQSQLDLYIPYCGDGNLDPGEQCDSANSCCDQSTCTFLCNGKGPARIYCYQEFATKSETCGAQGDGTESPANIIGEEAIDGDWSSGTSGHLNTGSVLELIYHKPINAIQNDTLLVFNANPNDLSHRHYATIPESCWNYNPNFLYIAFTVYDKAVRCYDGTGPGPYWSWKYVTDMDGFDYLVENGMNWAIGVECTQNSDCNDNNIQTTDSCSGTHSCQHTYVPYCGDDNVDNGEQCDEGVLNGQLHHCNAQCSGITASVCENGCEPEIMLDTGEAQFTVETDGENNPGVPEFSPLTVGIAVLGASLGLAFLRKH